MAMNLRVPEELDRRLEQLAAEEHTSKSALLLQGAELVLQRHARRLAARQRPDRELQHLGVQPHVRQGVDEPGMRVDGGGALHRPH